MQRETESDNHKKKLLKLIIAINLITKKYQIEKISRILVIINTYYKNDDYYYDCDYYRYEYDY